MDMLPLVNALRTPVSQQVSEGNTVSAVELISMAKDQCTKWAREFLLGWRRVFFGKLKAKQSYHQNKITGLLHQTQVQEQQFVVLAPQGPCFRSIPFTVSQTIAVAAKPELWSAGLFSSHAEEGILLLERGRVLSELLPWRYALASSLDPARTDAVVELRVSEHREEVEEGEEAEEAKHISMFYCGMYCVACSPSTLLSLWNFVCTPSQYMHLKDMATRIVGGGDLLDGDFQGGSTDDSFVTFARARACKGKSHSRSYLCTSCAKASLNMPQRKANQKRKRKFSSY